MLPSKAPRALQAMGRPSIRQTTMAAPTARPARKPRAQSRRRSWAIMVAGEVIEKVYKPGSELVLLFLVEKLQQLAIEDFGDLKMRYVPFVGNDHQLGAGNRVGDVFGQCGEILAVSLSTQNQRLGPNVRPVIDDRIQIGDLLINGAHHGEARPIAAECWGVQNAHVLLVLRFPGIGKVALDIGISGLPHLILGARHGCFVGLFRAVPWLAPTYIGQADGIVEYYALGHIRIRSGEAGGQHTAHGVAYDRRFRYAERLQQRERVQRHIVKVVRDDRLRGTAESDLVGHDHAKSGLAQGIDRTTEVEAPEIHSVEQNDGAAVWLACGGNIHIRHAHVLAVERQWQVAHWIWIRNILIGDTVRIHVGRSFGRVRSSDEGDEPAGENYE